MFSVQPPQAVNISNLDTSILQQIVEKHLTDFERFLEACSAAADPTSLS
jgi:hypothetical protein